uniref:Uncharacterized protein n=1 Tax=Glossina palpalis gambiensis TaxID=67801 RepID=A0A1B0B690_9MUSC
MSSDDDDDDDDVNVLSAVGIKIEVIITPHVSCNHHYSGSTLCSCCLAVLDDYQATSQAAKQLTSTRLDCITACNSIEVNFEADTLHVMHSPFKRASLYGTPDCHNACQLVTNISHHLCPINKYIESTSDTYSNIANALQLRQINVKYGNPEYGGYEDNKTNKILVTCDTSAMLQGTWFLA